MRDLPLKPHMLETLLRSAALGMILFLGVSLAATEPSFARKDPTYRAKIQEMANHSDLVVLGHVMALRKSAARMRVTIAVEETFQGDLNQDLINVDVLSGKIKIDPFEPEFTAEDRAILFLYKDNGVYRCVNGAYGKKTIIHENVYVNPENHFLKIDLDDYIEALNELPELKEEA